MTKMPNSAREPRSGNLAQRHCKKRNCCSVHERLNLTLFAASMPVNSAWISLALDIQYKLKNGGYTLEVKERGGGLTLEVKEGKGGVYIRS